jgi:flagellar basal-body rod protein FlgC
MDYFASFAISASGLTVEKLRMETAALNLANANSTAPAGSEPYSALTVVSHPTAAFENYLAGDGEMGAAAVTATLQPQAGAPRLVHDPSHPHADANGFVSYAKIDTLSEMVTMMRATRAYEANIKAINAAKAMAQQALDIGSSK